MQKLPIYEALPALKSALNAQNTVILEAPPGAGKSTVLPLELLQESWLGGKKILLLEPRRLAAKAVARRLAEQLNEAPGQTVGYRIRFETKVCSATRIEIVTEGILTRMLQQDNALEDTGLVIFDEFHERSLHADLALALCRESQQVLRNDLRILIMSATLDSDELLKALQQPPLITSQGRQYPIAYHYFEPDDSLPLVKNVNRLVLKALRENEGDLLVFLPGSGDIHRTANALEEAGVSAKIYPLYGDLPLEEQQQALLPDPNGYRKIVLSTSIAETSLTIQGIRVVVDSGYSRIPRYDLNTGLTRLETVRSSLDTADQRAGRAGRLGPGVCYRMWPERTTQHLAPKRKPEILQADLSQLILELAGWGHYDPSALSWITAPPTASVSQAIQLLSQLGAIADHKITAAGRAMLDLPTHPRISHLLLQGKSIGYAAAAADVAALLEERDPLKGEQGTDLSLRIELLHRWRNKERVNADRFHLERIEKIARQWRTVLSTTIAKEIVPQDIIGELIAAAFPERIAKKEDVHGRYRLANGRAARLPETDPLIHEQWIAVAHLDAGIKEGKIFLAASFDPKNLLLNIKPVATIHWDDKSNAIVSRNEWRLGSLTAKQEPLRNPPPNQVANVVCSFIAKEGLHVFERTDETDQLQARVNCLRKWRPELGLPDFTDDGLLSTTDMWCLPFVGSIKKKEDLKKLKFEELLLSALSWEQQQNLQRLTPEKFNVPSGSAIRINYLQDGSSPILAVRLQEVFGLTESPTVNDSRTPMVLHLLSPGYKPVQVTQDLKNFWHNTYHDVRKELRLRYPKHSWPEDPWTATAVRGAIRKKT